MTLRRLLCKAVLGGLAIWAWPALAHNLIGANLNGIADYARNHEFVDVVKQSRLFLNIGQFDDSQPANLAPLGSDGWPSGDFRLLAMAAQQNTSGLAGRYTIVFNGRAELSTSGGGAGSISGQTHDATSDTTQAYLDFPAGAENLMIDFRNTGAGIRNLRVLRPGYDAATAPTFTTPFLEHVRRFSVLRFMDWMHTNTAGSIVNWADRTTLDKRRTEARVARWETVIELANTVERDLWINVPVNASDEYVTQLATQLRDGLKPTLNVYVEYSNEIWNFAFEQATFNADLARAEVSANRNSPLAWDGSTDANTWAMRRVALRLKQIADIFRGVWGASAVPGRIRPVLAGQMANNYHIEQGLRLLDEGLGVAPASVLYAVAGAPYVFASATPDAAADEASGLSASQILNGMAAGIAAAPGSGAYQYEEHAALAAWYGVKVLGYEGGFDSFGPNNLAAKRAANLDPRIRTLCGDYLAQWYGYGFEQLLWFSAGAGSYDTPFGMWPLLEDLTQPATPKNQCMDDALAAPTPRSSLGNAVAARVSGGAWRGSTDTSAPLSGLAQPFGFPGYVDYLLRAEVGGSYTLKLRGSAPAGERFALRLNNGDLADAVSLPESTGDSAALNVALRQGLNVLRVSRKTGASWRIESLQFNLVSATPTAARFSANAAGGTAALRLDAEVQAASADQGRTGQLWAVVALPGSATLYCLTDASSGAWAPCGSGFPSATGNTTLGSHTLRLVDGLDLRALSGAQFFVGYGSDLTDLLSRGSYARIYQVP